MEENLKSTNIKEHYTHTEDPFVNVEAIGLSMQRCSNGQEDPTTVIKIVINENYEQLKTIAEQLQSSGIVSQLNILQMTNFEFCGDSGEPEELWLMCSLTSNNPIDSVFGNQNLKSEESAYFLTNVLTILETCDNLAAKGIPFAVNKECFMTIKDEASPFLKVVMTPLIFFIKEVVISSLGGDEEEASKYLFEYHELIASAIQTFCHVPGTDELIQAIRARKSCTELAQLNIVKQCFDFVNGATCDLTEYQIEKKLGKGAFGVVF